MVSMAFVKPFEALSRSMHTNFSDNVYRESKATLRMNLIIPKTDARRCFLIGEGVLKACKFIKRDSKTGIFLGNLRDF